MRAIEILKLTSIYLGNDALYDELLDYETTSVFENLEREAKLMLRCLNLRLGEIASDYLPLLVKESVSAVDNKLKFSDLSKPCINLFKLKNLSNGNERYKIFSDFISIKSGDYEIEYSTSLSEVSFNGEFQYPLLSERILAYAVAAEYLLISTLSDESQIWQTRFEDAIKVISRKRCELKLPKRRWI